MSAKKFKKGKGKNMSAGKYEGDVWKFRHYKLAYRKGRNY